MNPVVLVADADPFRLGLIDEACRAAGFEVVTAFDGRQVLDMIARQPPAMLVVHATLDNLPCVEVIEVLRADRALAGIPIVVIGEAPFQADGHIEEPLRVTQIQATVGEALRAARDRRRKQRESMPPPAEPGTRAQLLMTLEYELTHAARFHRPLSCLAIEITDEAPVLGAIRSSLRSVDLIFRVSGALIALLPDTDAEGAKVAANRLRTALNGTGAVLGSATAPAPGLDTPQALLGAARGSR